MPFHFFNDSFYQILETSHAGKYKVWTLIKNELHSVTVSLPRMFYVNYKLPREDGPSKCPCP